MLKNKFVASAFVILGLFVGNAYSAPSVRQLGTPSASKTGAQPATTGTSKARSATPMISKISPSTATVKSAKTVAAPTAAVATSSDSTRIIGKPISLGNKPTGTGQSTQSSSSTLLFSLNSQVQNLQNDVFDTIETVRNETSDAIGATKSELNTNIDTAKAELNTAIAAKADTETVNTNISAAKSELNTNIDTAKTELNSTIATTKSELNTNIDTAKAELNTAIAAKADTETVNTNIAAAKSELNTNIDTAKTELNTAIAAKADTETVNTNIAAAKSELNTNIDTAKTELNTAIAAKADTETVNTNIAAAKSELNTNIDAAKTELNSTIATTKSDLLTSIALKADADDLDDIETRTGVIEGKFDKDSDNNITTLNVAYVPSEIPIERVKDLSALNTKVNGVNGIDARLTTLAADVNNETTGLTATRTLATGAVQETALNTKIGNYVTANNLATKDDITTTVGGLTFRTHEDDIQFTAIADPAESDWHKFATKSDLSGTVGQDGKNIKLQKTEDKIQWAVDENGATWHDLYTLAEVQGADACDTVITKSAKADGKFTITAKDCNNTTLWSEEVEDGTDGTTPTVCETTITKSAKADGKFTITAKDCNNTTLWSEEVEDGTDGTTPTVCETTITKSAKADGKFTITAKDCHNETLWSEDVEDGQNGTATACDTVITKSAKADGKFTITAKDCNNETLWSEEVEDGTDGTTPTVCETTITKSAKADGKFTITAKNCNDETLWSEEVEDGQNSTVDQEQLEAAVDDAIDDLGLGEFAYKTELQISDITNLQNTLNAKQAAGDYLTPDSSIALAKVTGLQTALDGKQAAGTYLTPDSSIALAKVTGLQTALDGKQAVGTYLTPDSSIALAKVTGLQDALDAKQAAGDYLTSSSSIPATQLTGTISNERLNSSIVSGATAGSTVSGYFNSGVLDTDALPTVPANKIADLSGTYATTAALSGKQDTISDLSTIRSDASAGATAAAKFSKTDGLLLEANLPTTVVKSTDAKYSAVMNNFDNSGNMDSTVLQTAANTALANNADFTAMQAAIAGTCTSRTPGAEGSEACTPGLSQQGTAMTSILEALKDKGIICSYDLNTGAVSVPHNQQCTI